MIPTTIGARYTVLSRLGAGGMAAVYRAKDTRLLREVAVKVLFENPEPEYALMFNREARAYAALRHPNIVQVYDFSGTEESPPYLVLELVDGLALDKLVAEKFPLPHVTTVSIVYAVASALAHAHERGVIHRDIKPANVLVERGGRVLLSDFGIAKAYRDPTQLGATVNLPHSRLVGTPTYMAPEQVMEKDVGPATDVFALGSLVYALLTGRSPFGDTKDVVNTLRRIVDVEYTPVELLAPTCPVEVRAWVRSCLQREAADRPPAATVAADCAAWLAARAIADPTRRIAAALAEPSAEREQPDEWDATQVAPPPTQAGEPMTTTPAGKAAPATEHAPGRRALVAAALGAGALAVVLVVGLRVCDSPPTPTSHAVPGSAVADTRSPPQYGPAPAGSPVEGVAPPPAGGGSQGGAAPLAESVPRAQPLPRSGLKPGADVASRSRSHGRALAAPAKLEVNVRPWGKVEIDGVVQGNTPVFRSTQVRPGRHVVVVLHPTLGRAEEIVVVHSGENRVVTVDLRSRLVE